MWKIEKLDESGSRGRWVPVGTAKTEREAEQARRVCVEDAMSQAANDGAWRTPRFRVVRAFHFAHCLTVQ